MALPFCRCNGFCQRLCPLSPCGWLPPRGCSGRRCCGRASGRLCGRCCCCGRACCGRAGRCTCGRAASTPRLLYSFGRGVAFQNNLCHVETHSIGLGCSACGCTQSAFPGAFPFPGTHCSHSSRNVDHQRCFCRLAQSQSASWPEVHSSHQKKHSNEERNRSVRARSVIEAHRAVQQPDCAANEPDFVRQLHFYCRTIVPDQDIAARAVLRMSCPRNFTAFAVH